jgi:hypothetical protein
LYATAQEAPVTSSVPGVKAYVADMQKYGRAFALNENSEAAWTSMWVFQQVADKLKNVTRSSLLKAMGHLHNFNMDGLTAPLTTTHAVKVPGTPGVTRLFQPDISWVVVKHGRIYAFDSKFHNPFTGAKVAS